MSPYKALAHFCRLLCHCLDKAPVCLGWFVFYLGLGCTSSITEDLFLALYSSMMSVLCFQSSSKKRNIRTSCPSLSWKHFLFLILKTNVFPSFKYHVYKVVVHSIGIMDFQCSNTIPTTSITTIVPSFHLPLSRHNILYFVLLVTTKWLVKLSKKYFQ